MAERKSREAKSDTGILSLVNDMMKQGFGLTPETVAKMLKIVRSQGELAQMKLHVRGLSGGTYKRFNQALDMAEKDAAKKIKSGEEDKDDRESSPEKKKDVKESTFLKFLMTELTDLDVAQTKLDASGDKGTRIKRARQGDAQLRKDLAQDQKDLKTSDDPIDKQIAAAEQRVALLRKKKADQAGR